MYKSDDIKAERRSGFLNMLGIRRRQVNELSTEVQSFFAQSDRPAEGGAQVARTETVPTAPIIAAPPLQKFYDVAQTMKKDETHLAYRDPLTDLPNRRATEARLEEALSAAKRANLIVGVAFIDIDGFKQINDTHGHQVGDDVLIEIAARFRAQARSSELVTRFGGDEFAVIFPSVATPSEISDAVSRLQGAFDQTFNFEGHRFDLSASIGIAVFPEDAATAVDLIKHADEAMYQAKILGKSKVCWYSPELGEALSARRELLERLNDPTIFEELFLCYQPIVDVATQEIVAAEALLRWQHPSLGLLNASRILKMAAGPLPAAIEAWVIATVLSHISAWAKADVPLRASLNLARIDDATFERLSESLEVTGVDPKFLTIEIPERVVSADSKCAFEFGKKCADRGVDIALDRFMGELNIAELGQLPFTSVKLASELLAGIRSEGEGDSQFLRAVINVAQSFGLTVVATGVERTAQQRWLLGAGVRLMQGYGKIAPMNHTDFTDWLVRATGSDAPKKSLLDS